MDSKRHDPLTTVARVVVAATYRLVSLSFVGMDIPTSANVSPLARIYHGMGLVIHKDAQVDAGVVLRQNTTIGKKNEDGPAPVIRSGADIGANCVVLGGVTIGAHAVIGAGSVVLHDVAAGARVAGVPARSIEPGRRQDGSSPGAAPPSGRHRGAENQ